VHFSQFCNAQILSALLDLINEKVPVSVLMHILIAISYLSKEEFKDIIESCQLHEKIAKFIEKYSQINTTGKYDFNY